MAPKSSGPDSIANANAYAERWVSSARSECLDWLLIRSERHLVRVIAEYIEHYNHAPAASQPRPSTAVRERCGSSTACGSSAHSSPGPARRADPRIRARCSMTIEYLHPTGAGHRRPPGRREQALAGSVGGRASRGQKQARRAREDQDHGRAGELVQCLRRNRTASTMITMITIAPKLINMGYSSRMRGAQDGEPGRRGGEPRGAARRAPRGGRGVTRPGVPASGVVVTVRSGGGRPRSRPRGGRE